MRKRNGTIVSNGSYAVEFFLIVSGVFLRCRLRRLQEPKKLVEMERVIME